jgi:hypothetical protein
LRNIFSVDFNKQREYCTETISDNDYGGDIKIHDIIAETFILFIVALFQTIVLLNLTKKGHAP